jgi:alpha-L-fucosidase 2
MSPHHLPRRAIRSALGVSALLLTSAPRVLAQDASTAAPTTSLTPSLWYRAPAARWEEALPVGNGRLGAMVFGGVEQEHLQLNEETLWSGGPYDPVVKGASVALPEIRRLLFAGEIAKAHDLFGRHMMGVPYEQM